MPLHPVSTKTKDSNVKTRKSWVSCKTTLTIFSLTTYIRIATSLVLYSYKGIQTKHKNLG